MLNYQRVISNKPQTSPVDDISQDLSLDLQRPGGKGNQDGYHQLHQRRHLWSQILPVVPPFFLSNGYTNATSAMENNYCQHLSTIVNPRIVASLGCFIDLNCGLPFE